MSSGNTVENTTTDNVNNLIVPSTSTTLDLARRYEDIRKSSSSGSSSPLMHPILTNSGITTSGGLVPNFHGNFLHAASVMPPSGPHLLPPPLLLMSSSATTPHPPTCSPPVSASPPVAMQSNSKLLVRPHPHRLMPTSPQLPNIPPSTNPYFNIQENLDTYGTYNVVSCTIT